MKLFLFLLAPTLLLAPLPALAGDAPDEAGSETTSKSATRLGPAFEVNLAVDLPITLVAGLSSVAWVLGDELGSAHCAPLCDPGTVNAFDRHVAGNYDERWARVSDGTLAGVIGTGLIALFADDGFASGIVDFVVMAESVLITNGLIIALNLAARRPRPYLYSEKAPEKVRASGTASLSFPSGHVGMASALTTSVFRILYTRRPGSVWPWVWLGAGTAMTGVIAAGRVMAGRHFITDAMIGGALGICIGILVPALHEKNLTVSPAVMGEDTAGLTLNGSF